MKLVSFRRSDADSFGIAVGSGVVDLHKRYPKIPDLRTLIAEVPTGELSRFADEKADYDFAQIELRPPIPNPDKIICIGVNYHAHLAEIGMARPDYPMIFLRFANTQVGHGRPLIRPRESE